MGRKNSKKKKHKESTPRSIQGTLDITRSGVGFVMVDKEQQDILVRPADFNTALHGDTVRVEVAADGRKGQRRRGIIKIELDDPRVPRVYMVQL